MNKIEFVKDMLGRELSLHQIERKYNVLDAVGTYHMIKDELGQEVINNVYNQIYR